MAIVLAAGAAGGRGGATTAAAPSQKALVTRPDARSAHLPRSSRHHALRSSRRRRDVAFFFHDLRESGFAYARAWAPRLECGRRRTHYHRALFRRAAE